MTDVHFLLFGSIPYTSILLVVSVIELNIQLTTDLLQVYLCLIITLKPSNGKTNRMENYWCFFLHDLKNECSRKQMKQQITQNKAM